MANLSTTKTLPETHFTWLNRGKLLAQLGYLEAALDCFERALVLQEHFYEAWCEKGSVLERLHRFAEADFCFNQSLGAFCGEINWHLQDETDMILFELHPSN